MMDQIDLQIQIRLRPVRFAFLVRPHDLKSLQRIFEINACLWGGMFNPIIPYFGAVPTWWERDFPHSHRTRRNARRIIDGLLDFFEPDFIVESQKGLASRLSLPKEITLQLEDILAPSHETHKGFGLNVFELYRDLYQKEFKFIRRDKSRIVNVVPAEKGATHFASCLFGAFPNDPDLEYIGKAYKDAFAPEERVLNPEYLKEYYEKSHLSPLRVGSAKLDVQHSDLGEPTLYLLDSTSPIDLMDFWNIRAVYRRVRAIPIQWLETLSGFCKEFIIKNHVPLPRNPSGLMINTTIQIPRSITKEKGEELWNAYLKLGKPGASRRFFYPPFWQRESDLVWSPKRPTLTARKKTETGRISGGYLAFATLNPDFAEDFGNNFRWANVVNFAWGIGDDETPKVFPNNLRDPLFPDLSHERVLSTCEGIVVYPKYKELGEYWRLTDGQSLFCKWLERRDIKADVSEAGKTTLQVIRNLGGLAGAGAIAHPKILELLNKMANKHVHSSIETPSGPKEYFGRTIKHGDLRKLLHELKNENPLHHFSVAGLTSRQVIKLGLEVKCQECGYLNWYPLDSLKYTLVCEQCLKEYAFPSSEPTNRQVNWCYRTIGPFSRPDYAGGAYACALAIRFFSHSLLTMDAAITWACGLNMTFESKKSAEIDFCLWYQRDHGLEYHHSPKLVFGECKSFGRDSFGSRDIRRLRNLASLFPGSFFVFATLTDRLTEKEKQLIASLALWGREYTGSGETRAPVIILTGNELFASLGLSSAWKQLGGLHEAFAENYIRGNLHVLADMTQQLYLGVQSYGQWSSKKWEERVATKSRLNKAQL